jgi:hypothetical protein
VLVTTVISPSAGRLAADSQEGMSGSTRTRGEAAGHLARRRARNLVSLLMVFAFGFAWALSGPSVLPAYAEGTVSRFDVDASLAPDGSLTVVQTATFSGAPPATLSQRIETQKSLLGDRHYVYTLGDIAAAADDSPVTPEVTSDDGFATVTLQTNGATEIRMEYTVVGAVVPLESGTALQWPLLQGLSAQVTELTATVAIPGSFDYVRCTAGPPNTTTPCDYAAAGVEDARVPSFRDGPRGRGEIVAVDIGFPPGSVAANAEVEQRWTFRRAFSAEPLPLGVALAALLLGGLGLYALHRRAGFDVNPQGEILRVGDFAPVGEGESVFEVVGDVRPGHVGTVVDERVDPIDVTATLLDLAVRGHLLITELPRESEFAPTEWTLQRRHAAHDRLLPFEQELLDDVLPEGEAVTVSDLAGRVQTSIGSVQDRLYDEVVHNGWYERRPDSTRSRWTQLGVAALVVAVVATVVLAAFTTFGLLGLALLVIALGLVFVGQEMPARTGKGSALLAGLGVLRSDLLSHPTSRMPHGHELRELSKVLPYAVVLGGAERWLTAMVESDVDETPDSTELDWYHGPHDWHLRDLPNSLRNFITTVSGSLFSR